MKRIRTAFGLMIVTMPRALCVLLRLHQVAGVLIRRADGSIRVDSRCPVCGAAA